MSRELSQHGPNRSSPPYFLFWSPLQYCKAKESVPRGFVEQVFLILNIQALPGGFPSFVCRFRDNSQPVHQLDLTIPGAPAEVSFLATEETWVMANLGAIEDSLFHHLRETGIDPVAIRGHREDAGTALLFHHRPPGGVHISMLFHSR